MENFPFRNTGTEGDNQLNPIQEVTALPENAAAPNRPRSLRWLSFFPGWIRWTVIGVGGVLLLAGALFALQIGRNANKNRVSFASQSSATRFNALQLPLDEFIAEGSLALGDQNRTLTVNGQLKANNTLLIAPTPQPSQATAGQIYFDRTSNQLAYFNGTQFVNMGQQQTNVTSLGGGSGIIGLGGGLALAGGALTNVGVLSVQGQTGDVVLAAGNGIDVTGTTITNIGVVSFGGQSGDIGIGTGLSASAGTIRNSGVLSVAAGTPNLLVTNDGDGNLTVSSIGGGSGTLTSSGGTAGRIAKFTASQNLEDSLLSEAAGTVTVNGNLAVTGLTANGVLVGNGASAISSVTAGGVGLCFMSTAGAPSWQACPGSGGVTSLNGATGALSIANATQAGGVITLNNASTSAKGIAQFNATNFTVASGVVNTIQNINTTANPTFAGINTSTITPNGTPLTVGSITQDLALQGSNVLLTRTSGANATSLSFSAPTANVTYRLQTAAAGTYDVCTTVGNCVGVGGTVSTSGGTTNQLAKFTGSQTLGDSLISDNGTLVTIGGDLSVSGTVTLATPLAVAQGGTGSISPGGARTNLGAAASGANNDITSISGLTTALSVVQGGTGATNLTANGVLLGNGTSPISSLAAGGAGLCLVSTAGAPSWQACPGSGGGVTSLNGLTGVLTLANASGAGGTITINDASTSQKGIASFNSTNFSVSSGAVTTIQDIHITATPTFGTLALSSSQATSPMLLVNNTNGSATGNLIDLQLNGASRMAVTPAGNMTLSGTINGQTISSSASFTGSVTVAGAANFNGGATVAGTLGANTITPSAAMTIGATAQNVTVQGAAVNLTSTNAGNTTALNFQTPTANVTYRLQTAAAGTYDICTTVGNCAGAGGGVTTSGGTTNRLAKFTGSQIIGDSIITDNGTTVTVGGALSVNTLTPSAALTIGATAQDVTLQGANVALTATNGGITNTLTFAPPATSNKTITLPNASGTVAVSASGPLAIDAAGNITCSLCVTSGGGGGGAGAVDSLNSLTGDIILANASGAGGTVTINDASTSQKGIAQFNSTNFSASGGVINTIQDINTTAAPTFGRLTVTSSQATNDMFVVNNSNASGTGALLRLQLNGANRFTVDPAGNVVTAGTLTSGNINGQTISSAANFTGSLTVAGAANLAGGATVTGTLGANTITPSAAMTIGATTQNLTLQGAVTSLTSTNAGNTTALNFQTPTANVTYRLLTAAAGTYDICTTAGNCAGVGGGVTTSGGTLNVIPKFTSSQGIGDSNISDNGTTVTIGVNLAVNTITPTTAMVIGATGEDLTLQGANVALTETAGGFTNTLGFATPSGNNKSITIPNASGTVAVSASGPLAIDASGNITCATCVTGTAVTSLNSQTGAVTIANASGAGGTVAINDASTSQKGIASFNSTNFTASSGAINTVQDINTTAAPTFGRLTVTSNQASNDLLTVNNTNASGTGNLLKLQLNSADRFTVDAAGNVVAAGTITSGNINGQTISSAANFTGSVAVGTTLSVNTITPSAAMTVGATNQNLTLQGASTSLTSTSGANTSALTFQTPTANVTYRLLTATAGTYDICTTVGNCAGVGGGVTTSGGTTNRLAKFTGSQAIGDSIISDNGTTVDVAGSMNLATGNTYQINGTQISSANLSNDANLAKLNTSQTFTGDQNIFRNTVNSAAGFVVQRADSVDLLTVDTTNSTVVIGQDNFAGKLVFKNASNVNGITLQSATASTNRTINLPNEDGTVCLQGSTNCGFALSSGSGNYIQNGTTVQNANMYIKGSDTSFPTAVFEQAASGTADVLNVLKNDGTTKYLSVSSAGNFSLNGGSTYSLSSSGSGSVTSSGAITITAGGGSTWSTSSGALAITAATNLTLNSTGTLSVGSSSTSTLNIGSASNNTRTINIGTAGTSAAQTVAIGSGGTSNSTTAIQGGTGANAVTLAAAAGGSISSTVTGAGNINFNTAASIFAKASANSTNTFQVQNAATRGILTVDTTNGRTILGNITSTLGQGVAGSLVLADGTNDNFGLTLNTATLANNRTITLPDASGTICLQSSTSCGFAAASGSNSYINNTAVLQQNANIAIESAADSSISLFIKNRATQSSDSIRVVDSNDTEVFSIDAFGSGAIANQFAVGTFLGVGLSASSGTQIRTAVADANTTGIQIMGDNSQIADLFQIDGAGTRALNYTGGGTLDLIAGSGQTAPLLRLNDSGGSPVFTAEPDGDVDIDGVYKVNGTSGSTVTCSGGQFLQNLTASGGIVTGGTCASAGGGSTTLQQAYTASTGGTTPEIKLDSTRGALDIQDADSTIGANLFNIRAANGSGLGSALLSIGNTGQVTSQNSSNSTTAFRVLTQGGASMFTIDTTNSRAYVGDPTADSTGALLVLDTKNTAGDPTGVAGAMYYNSTMGRMRCFMENTWRFCNDPNDLRWGYNIQEDFAANQNIGILGWRDASIGTGSVAAQIADVASRPGQTRLATGGSGTGAIFFDGSTDSGTFFIQGGEEIEFSLKINNLATSTTDYDVRAGLCELMDSPCNSGVYIEYNRDLSVNWRINTAGGVGATSTNSSKAVATGWTSFRIVANSTSSIDFYAKHESDSAYALLGNITTNIPTTQVDRSMGMVHISKALDAGTGATDRFVDVDYFGIRNSFTSPR